MQPFWLYIFSFAVATVLSIETDDKEDAVLKVAVFSSHPPQKCGIAVFNRFLFESMRNVEASVFVIDNPLYGVDFTNLDVAEPEILSTNNNDNNTFRLVGKVPLELDRFDDFAKEIDLRNFDVILVQHEFAMWLEISIETLLCKFKTPVVTIVHTVFRYPQEHEIALIRGLSICSRTVIALTKASAVSLSKGYGIPSNKIAYVPHGVPEMAIDELYELKKQSRMDLNLDSAKKKVLITNGLLHPSKGLHHAIEAFKSVVISHPEAVYYIVGSTNGKAESIDYLGKLKRRVGELGLEDHVTFVNHYLTEAEMRMWVSAADIFVAPYDEHCTTSGTLLFAMAHGCAIVATNFRHAAEMLANVSSARTVFVGDAQGIAAEMNRLLDSNSLLITNQKQVHDVVYSTSTWPKVAAITRQILQTNPSLFFTSFSSSIGIANLKEFDYPEASITHILDDDSNNKEEALLEAIGFDSSKFPVDHPLCSEGRQYRFCALCDPDITINLQTRASIVHSRQAVAVEQIFIIYQIDTLIHLNWASLPLLNGTVMDKANTVALHGGKLFAFFNSKDEFKMLILESASYRIKVHSSPKGLNLSVLAKDLLLAPTGFLGQTFKWFADGNQRGNVCSRDAFSNFEFGPSTDFAIPEAAEAMSCRKWTEMKTHVLSPHALWMGGNDNKNIRLFQKLNANQAVVLMARNNILDHRDQYHQVEIEIRDGIAVASAAPVDVVLLDASSDKTILQNPFYRKIAIINSIEECSHWISDLLDEIWIISNVTLPCPQQIDTRHISTGENIGNFLLSSVQRVPKQSLSPCSPKANETSAFFAHVIDDLGRAPTCQEMEMLGQVTRTFGRWKAQALVRGSYQGRRMIVQNIRKHFASELMRGVDGNGLSNLVQLALNGDCNVNSAEDHGLIWHIRQSREFRQKHGFSSGFLSKYQRNVCQDASKTPHVQLFQRELGRSPSVTELSMLCQSDHSEADLRDMLHATSDYKNYQLELLRLKLAQECGENPKISHPHPSWSGDHNPLQRSQPWSDLLNFALPSKTHCALCDHQHRHHQQQRKKAVVRWEGPVFSYEGFATVTREIVRRLVEKPNDVFDVESHSIGDRSVPDVEALILKGDPNLIKSSSNRFATLPSVTIRMYWPPNWQHPPESSVWVMYQPWEFCAVPVEWIKAINDAPNVKAEIWVPTTYVRDCYLKSGLDEDKVFLVPHGVNANVFRPDVQQLPQLKQRLPGRHEDRVTFLFRGGDLPRKGLDLLIEAFSKEFSSERDNVYLVVHTIYGDKYASHRIHDIPNIVLFTDKLETDQVPQLYTTADIYVHPYRSEGYGLPIVEAMSSGLPVIVPNGGAALDFVCDSCGWFVQAREVVCDVAPCGKKKVFSSLTAKGLDPTWLEVDVHDLRRVMREAAASTNKAEREMRGRKAREHAASKLSWDLAAKIANDRIVELINAQGRKKIEQKVTYDPGVSSIGVLIHDVIQLTRMAPTPSSIDTAKKYLESQYWHRPNLLQCEVGVCQQALDRMVTDAYISELGHVPDAVGKQIYTAALKSGEMDVWKLQLELRKSDEGKERLGNLHKSIARMKGVKNNAMFETLAIRSWVKALGAGECPPTINSYLMNIFAFPYINTKENVRNISAIYREKVLRPPTLLEFLYLCENSGTVDLDSFIKEESEAIMK